MIRRYTSMFDRLRQRREAAFGAFVMLGDPDLETSARILDLLVEAGADMLEVGIPFSDPVADGPTIQAAADRALRQGVTPPDCFHLISEFRARHPDVPVGILTYANIVLAPGLHTFYRAAARAGVDSVLIADVPAHEAEPFAAAARAAGVAPVLIAAPNTPRPTLQRIAHLGQGYTYCVARRGVTGAEREMELRHDSLFVALAEFGAPPPVLGFGISTPDHVSAAVEAGAAGVICGSALVGLIERSQLKDLRTLVQDMKTATIPAEHQFRPCHLPFRQPARPSLHSGADAGPAVQRGYHRANRGRRVCPLQLLYHLAVLMKAREFAWHEVAAVLRRRHEG